MRCPGVGVAMAMALAPVGVTPDGVMTEVGVMEEGVWGVWLPICDDGVSSQRDRRLEALGVGVSWIRSAPPVRSVRGVSAQPLPCPGVSLSVLGVSSQRLRLALGVPGAPPPFWLPPGVSWPGVAWPGVEACAGVGSHMRLLE
uniref:Uncharacterized protein n=1 Tax=Ixodes ricinus TaxID=34613 RepID=A0A6B0UUG5_IXORI